MKNVILLIAILLGFSNYVHANDLVKFKCDQWQKDGHFIVGVSAPVIVQKEDGNLYLMTKVISPVANPSYELLKKANSSKGIDTYIGTVHTFVVQVLGGGPIGALYMNDGSNVTRCLVAQ